MSDYLVYNDLTGEFVSADEVQAVTAGGEGSYIWIKGQEGNVISPLKPRELLRRLTIMRFNHENGKDTKTGRSTL